MITGDVDKFRIWDQQVWQCAVGEHEDTVLDDEEFLASLGLLRQDTGTALSPAR
jgi:hypothetical protein